MNLLRFGPVDRWQPWLLAAGIGWFWSVPPGFFLVLLAGQLPASEPALTLLFLGWVGIFAPAFSWLGLVLTLPPAWLLARFGWLGWLPAALLGAIGGVLAGRIIGGMDPAFNACFGTLSLLAIRAALLAR